MYTAPDMVEPPTDQLMSFLFRRSTSERMVSLDMPSTGSTLRRGGSETNFFRMSASISAMIFAFSAAMMPRTPGNDLRHWKNTHSAPRRFTHLFASIDHRANCNPKVAARAVPIATREGGVLSSKTSRRASSAATC